MSANLLTVTQLNEYMRMLTDGNALLQNVYVRGEISNFTNHYKTGHFYFSLKDENGLVRAVMFRSYAAKVAFVPENGMKVILHGRVSVFARDGQYQIYADDLQPDGIGALYLAYEQLRRKLEAEGLFDASRKRAIPRYPEKIGLITSASGAAVRDMIHILGRRFPVAEVFLYPALVQGAGAPDSLSAGLRFFNTAFPVDVILIGRGGGAAEDLFAFNDERLVREVAASDIPVISAVGHETDVTLCDFAADLRAPTPSAAAELAVPDRRELRDELFSLEKILRQQWEMQIGNERTRLSRISAARSLQSPKIYLEDRRMQAASLATELEQAEKARLVSVRAEFRTVLTKINALNPIGVLSRGYALIYDKDSNPITDAGRLSAGDRIRIRFAENSADATVTGIRESE